MLSIKSWRTDYHLLPQSQTKTHFYILKSVVNPIQITHIDNLIKFR